MEVGDKVGCPYGVGTITKKYPPSATQQYDVRLDNGGDIPFIAERHLVPISPAVPAAPKFKVGQRVKAISSGREGAVLHTDTNKIVTFKLDPAWQKGATEWTAYEHELELLDDVQSQATYEHKSWDATTGTCLACGISAAAWHSLQCSANIKPMAKTSDRDPKEEALFRKWMGDAATFRGEARCDFSNVDKVLNAAPKEPHFGYDNPRTQQSMLTIKRYLSTNLKAYPVCRHSGEPAQLVFDDWQHHDGDGKYLVPRFTCACWSNQ